MAGGLASVRAPRPLYVFEPAEATLEAIRLYTRRGVGVVRYFRSAELDRAGSGARRGEEG